MENKGNLRDFERDMVVGARQVGLSISETADFLGFTQTTISKFYREWSENQNFQWVAVQWDANALFKSEIRGEWPVLVQVQADREATAVQITTPSPYKWSMQESISESTTHQTLKQMGQKEQKIIPGVTPVS